MSARGLMDGVATYVDVEASVATAATEDPQSVPSIILSHSFLVSITVTIQEPR